MKQFGLSILLLPLISNFCFADDRRPIRDPAPSGRETSETHVYRDSTVTVPGRDTTVDVTTNGNRTRLDFDPSGKEVPGHPDDTTIVDHRPRQ